MLEIFALSWLTKRIGTIVEEKGHKSGRYKAMAVALWFGGEISGAILGLLFLSVLESEWLIYVFALVGAGIGAGIAFLIASNLSPIGHLAPSQITSQLAKESIKIDERQLPLSEFVHVGDSEPPGILALISNIGAGFVQSCFSPAFYFRAVRRRVTHAIGFFLVFALAITVLQIFNLVIDVSPFRDEVNQAFDRNVFPEISISNGEAIVHGSEPFVLLDEGGSLVVIDTTGEYAPSMLESGQYQDGFLLTKKTLYIYDRYEGLIGIQLSDIQAILGNPFHLNAKFVQTILNWFVAIAFISLAIWNSVFRFIYIVLIGLIVWGITAMVKRGTDFGPVLITGLYANVPAIYAHYLLGLFGISFCGLQTALLLLAWGLGLRAALGGSATEL